MQAVLILFNNEFFRLDFPELITREKLWLITGLNSLKSI